LRAPTKSKLRRSPAVVFVRLGQWAQIETQGRGSIVAVFESEPVSLGKFGAGAAESLQALRTGLPLGSVGLEDDSIRDETDLLVRRLAGLGLLEYPIREGDRSQDDLAVIEPQAPAYWPRKAELSEGDTLLLSRFAYLRRREDEFVLESPRARALVRLLDPSLANIFALLSAPQKIEALRAQDGFPGPEILSLLVSAGFLFKVSEETGSTGRYAEGDEDFALWDFHDLLFHSRSTEGLHSNPIGGTYPHQGAVPQKPALRPSWPGEKIDLRKDLDESPEALLPIAKILRERHSARVFDDRKPITLAELSQFLDGTARVFSKPAGEITESGRAPTEDVRPYPCAGASWELELYLTVNNCKGLAPGFYHYDAAAHALVKLGSGHKDIRDALLGAARAMGEETPPQILITIAARFGRVSWKYSSIAYSLILKDAGVLMQTLYLMAAGMGLGGCAIGLGNIEKFERMTGIEFHVEGPVGQFALGRPGKAPAAN